MTLDNFLCCFNLEFGGLVIGWVGLIVNIILAIIALVGAFIPATICQQFELIRHHRRTVDILDFCDDIGTVTTVAFVILFFLLLIFAYAHSCLIRGISARDPDKLKWVWVLYIAIIVLCVLHLLGSFISFWNFFAALIELIVAIYFFMVIDSLIDKYRVDWPKHVAVFNLLDNFIERFEKHPEQREIQKIFSIDGDISDSTIIVIVNNRDILIDTLDPEFKLLKIGIRLINFDAFKKFMGAKIIYREIIMEMIEERNLKLVSEDKTIMVHMPKDDALKLEINPPYDFEIKNLSLDDAEKINSVWAFASPGSLNFIRYVIKFNASIGIYKKSTKTLIAWCLEYDHHCLLALQVDANHLRKGFGILAAKALTKKLAEEKKVDVVTTIVCENYKSKNLFDKIGFNQIDNNLWIGVIKN
ncbi:hypothetical protein PVAND_016853 [Polypedilum vanderplanki]|uniref:GCN5-related N-acetyltransferase Rv2170-like domain-containing protein n=1 Tax=Polypedilum vanderplanki TaxID=319348 RepID=A0A9J6BHE9_POLVA|nr:hypothetical protein PVAND_016853 [Polypedilum vanderplanki]